MAEKAERSDEPHTRNGNLSIPLPFEDAIKAALEVPPKPKPPRKKREPKKAQPKSA
jgi:hypothetical protein